MCETIIIGLLESRKAYVPVPEIVAATKLPGSAVKKSIQRLRKRRIIKADQTTSPMRVRLA